MNKPKFGAPPSRTRPLQSPEDFVSGALRPVMGAEREDASQSASPAAQVSGAVVTPPTHAYPWEGLDDKRRREMFNIRFTDAEKAMLKFLEENGRDSMHAICVEILRPELLRRIDALTGERMASRME